MRNKSHNIHRYAKLQSPSEASPPETSLRTGENFHRLVHQFHFWVILDDEVNDLRQGLTDMVVAVAHTRYAQDG